MRSFVRDRGQLVQYWTIELSGARCTVNKGLVGKPGKTEVQDFADEAAARAAQDRRVAEKLAGGYVETTPPEVAATPLRRSLEEALAESSDDLAAHSAYADYLMEQGDPRGELIQVQLALEGGALPSAERERLRRREAALLAQHQRRWMGDVGRFLIGEWSGEDKPFHYAFARGWLDVVRVLPFPAAVIAALARSPEARLLRRLEIVYDMRYHPHDFDRWVEGPARALTAEDGAFDLRRFYLSEGGDLLSPLLASPYLGNLRSFKLGFSDSGECVGYSGMVAPFTRCDAHQVVGLLRKCPRLEGLSLNAPLQGMDDLLAAPEMARVRELQYYYGDDLGPEYEALPYPLEALAGNAAAGGLRAVRLMAGRVSEIRAEGVEALLRSPHLGGLRELQVRNTTFGDEGCRRLVATGGLGRLKVLDLARGALTDAGARALAGCAGIGGLERLDVSRNALTAEGVAALRGAVREVVADDQHEEGEDEYLFEVDFE